MLTRIRRSRLGVLLVPCCAVQARAVQACAVLACAVMACAVMSCGDGDPTNEKPTSTPVVASADGTRSGRQPVAHLVESFSTAVVEQEVAGLELGTPETRRHLLSGWGEDERDDVRSYVWGLGESSSFEFFLVDVFDSELALHGRAFSFEGAEPQTVEVIVNGQALGRIEVGESFARYRIDVPGTHLRPGRNHFELRYGRHHPPRQVIAGAIDDRPLAVLWYSLELAGVLAAKSPKVVAESIQLPVGNRLSYFQDIVPGDELVLGQVEVSGASALRVELETMHGRTTWEPTADSLGQPLRWALPVESEQLARLSLVSRRADAGLWGRLTGWLGDGPQISLLLPVILRTVSDGGDAVRGDVLQAENTSGAENSAEPAPDIIIYLIDTLRADRLGTYGYERPTSPRIDQFAAEATVFTNAQAQSSWTRTGVTSLFTGMLPQAHGVNRRDEALSPDITTMAEALKAQGYTTLGFITNGNVDAAFGLDQGFNHYQYLRESEDNVDFHQTAERLNHWVFKYLDTLAPRGQRPPFFLYIHATDPHAPYTPADDYYERFAAGVDRQRGWIEHVHDISAGRVEAPEGTAEAWSDLYDGEIAYTDHHFGRLLDKVQTMGLASSSLMVLVSDHGEEFFEHGGWEHGKTLYGEQLRVPLIVRLPDSEGAGQRLPILANQMDVLPTLLDYLGTEGPPLVQGQSLLPWMRGAVELGKEPSYAYLRLGERHSQSVIDRGFKLIVDAAKRPQTEELFHVADDVAEAFEVSGEHPVEQGFLGQTLRRLEATLRRRGGSSANRVEIDEELKRRLEALGYLDN